MLQAATSVHPANALGGYARTADGKLAQREVGLGYGATSSARKGLDFAAGLPSCWNQPVTSGL